jgi:hypothetical protein
MILLTLLAGCASLREAPEPETLHLCFGSDAEAPTEWESQSWQVSGEVTALQTLAADENFAELNIYACWETPELMVSVLDEDGVTWTLGMGQGEEALPALEFAVGAQVDLQFSGVFSFGQTAGAVIEDADGLVFAADLGNWGRALDDQVSDGLRVTEGERTLTVEGSCGTQDWGQIDFQGDGDALSLETGERGTFELAGETLQALNAGSFVYTQATCTDVAGLESWMVWR